MRDGAGVSGARVVVLPRDPRAYALGRPGARPEVTWTTTDAEGHWQVDTTVGEYRVSATVDGLAPVARSLSVLPEDNEAVRLEVGPAAVDELRGTVHIDGGETLGRVVLFESNGVVAAARVTEGGHFRLPSTRPWGWTGEFTVVDEQGRPTAAAVSSWFRTGPVKLWARATRLVTGHVVDHGGASVPRALVRVGTHLVSTDDAGRFTALVAADENDELEVRARNGVGLATVEPGDRELKVALEPATWATIRSGSAGVGLFNLSKRTTHLPLGSAPHGEAVELWGLSPGEYAQVVDRHPVLNRRISIEDHPVQLEVAPLPLLAPRDVELQTKPEITGTVTIEAWSQVRVGASYRFAPPKRVALNDGHAVLPGIEPGDYVLTMAGQTSDGRRFGGLQDIGVEPDDSEPRFSIDIEPLGTLRGHVRVRKADRARVSVILVPNTDLDEWAPTDFMVGRPLDDGADFGFPDLELGRYQVRLMAERNTVTTSPWVDITSQGRTVKLAARLPTSEPATKSPSEPPPPLPMFPIVFEGEPYRGRVELQGTQQWVDGQIAVGATDRRSYVRTADGSATFSIYAGTVRMRYTESVCAMTGVKNLRPSPVGVELLPWAATRLRFVDAQGKPRAGRTYEVKELGLLVTDERGEATLTHLDAYAPLTIEGVASRFRTTVPCEALVAGSNGDPVEFEVIE